MIDSTSPAPSPLGGLGSTCSPKRSQRAPHAFPTNPPSELTARSRSGGEYQWRREGEYHLFNPETVFKLQHATRERRYDVFKEYTAPVDDQSAPATLRGLFSSA